MIRPMSVVGLSLLLSGCFNDLSGVQQYIAEVKPAPKPV
jgi:type IV pilus assembly protein PilP